MGELVDCDQEHLNLLKLSYYILAGTTGFFSLIAVLYIGLGALFASGVLPSTPNDAGNTRIMGLIFLSIGLVVMLISVAITFLTYWAGRCLRDRRHRTFCVVIACLSCLHVPFGTAIGVCTIIVLGRPRVRALFETPPAA
jgi:ABC-type branched-subunit amino acid transport system permease subunit